MGSDQTTRASLHGIAELLLAGPQYRQYGTIKLRVLPGAIATITAPDLRVDHLKARTHDTAVEMRGATYAELGSRLGVVAGAPEGLYEQGSGAQPTDTPVVDPNTAQALLDALDRGDQSLRRFAPDYTPVLWPEHFDVAITIARSTTASRSGTATSTSRTCTSGRSSRAPDRSGTRRSGRRGRWRRRSRRSRSSSLRGSGRW